MSTGGGNGSAGRCDDLGMTNVSRTRAAVTAVAMTMLVGSLVGAPAAFAVPSGFPDVDSQPTVDPADYYVAGAHPSLSGWTFSTASGLKCQDSLIAEMGVFCQGTARGSATAQYVSASVSNAGRVSQADTGLAGDYPLLPAGMRLATDNGVTCAALADDTLACRSVIPASWGPDVQNPPGKVYGEHGFVIPAAGAPTTF